ncbi:Uu.00g031850.m01.CDS01 [Anthostomella pinea]|uniref:Uu.00g031850.m01.CDS01 n=1 Tax=Anthostomella pinea TaxID=933095 RepID=A0AAI8V925_9PEZI|nr:Uu.00g031850.m01.CDS01 [Anthostomella pinea]
MMHSYNQHPGNSQQPTPPGTSRPWDYPVHDTSSSTAPMPLQSTTADIMEMHGLESADSQEAQGTMPDPTAHFHWGSYGVSSTEPQDDMSPHMAHQSLFPVQQLPGVAPSALMHTTSQMPLTAAPSHVPILQQSPDPRDLGSSATPINSLQHHYGHLGHHVPHVMIDFAPSSYSSRKTSKSSRTGRSGRSTKRARAPSRAVPNSGAQQDSLGGGTSPGSNRAPSKRLTLKEGAKEEDRYLLELRCQMNDDKGKGMWDQICTAFSDRFEPKERATLQMSLTRSVLKYAEWPADEDEALRRAVEEYERRRPTELLKLMKEYGGCQAWDWKDGHVVKRLVELGIDEFDSEEPAKKPRRQRKNAIRKQSPSRPWAASMNSQHHMPHYNDGSDIHTVTAEQEKYLLEQFCKPEHETPEPEPMHHGMEDAPLMDHQNAGAERERGEDQSARVAKQACEQMLPKRSDHQMYTSIAPGHHHQPLHHQHMSR